MNNHNHNLNSTGSFSTSTSNTTNVHFSKEQTKAKLFHLLRLGLYENAYTLCNEYTLKRQDAFFLYFKWISYGFLALTCHTFAGLEKIQEAIRGLELLSSRREIAYPVYSSLIYFHERMGQFHDISSKKNSSS